MKPRWLLGCEGEALSQTHVFLIGSWVGPEGLVRRDPLKSPHMAETQKVGSSGREELTGAVHPASIASCVPASCLSRGEEALPHVSDAVACFLTTDSESTELGSTDLGP